ncbi:MAG: hypothetical protein PHU97_00540 [Bacteroidales bacterium]|nr:hypothetical protein [Bacteroidales bacterium]MDD3009790.1 hypothetical protein [Bacteroidales bacterium]MDY0284751.1 hypothetical protein [Bacteroidales bacterium]
MKILIFRITFILTVFILSSCERKAYYDPCFPPIPLNFQMLNTASNDYNSNIGPGRRLQLTFSSDRYRTDFNFVVKRLDLVYRTDEGRLYIELVTNDSETVMNQIIYKANTAANEYGPHSVSVGSGVYLLYAGDGSGNLDIMYNQCIEASSEQTYFSGHVVTEASRAVALNSPYNEAYPCIEEDICYFCTDRTGNYDLCYTPVDKAFDLWIRDTAELALTFPANINSAFADQCPFIRGNLMVFTSNRDGGFGGYDLYYSLKDASGQWSDPVNFGEEINSESDEFRPVVSAFEDFTNDFMVFSSNRAGGVGGFDLYYVGIPKMIKLQ